MAEDLFARLVRVGLWTRDERAKALATATFRNVPLAVAAVESGLDEGALAGFFLSEGYGPLVGATELLAVRADVIRKIPPAAQRALYALPVRSTPGGLLVAMADASDAHAVQELARLAASPIVPAVARPSDLRAAFAHFAPVAITGPEDDAPPIALVTRPRTSSRAMQPVGSIPVVQAETTASDARALDGSSTEELEPVLLVRQKPVGARARTELASISKTVTSSAPAANTWSDLPPPQSTTPPPRASLAPDARALRSSRPARAPSSIPIHKSSAPRAPDVGRAIADLRLAESRDAAVRTACEVLGTFSRAVAFFAVRKGVVQGLDGAGEVSLDAVRNAAIPATTPSVVRTALTRSDALVASYGPSGADAVLRAALGSRGGEVLVQPVVVKERVVGVFCAEDVAFGDAGRHHFLTVALAVGAAFERLILAGKSE